MRKSLQNLLLILYTCFVVATAAAETSAKQKAKTYETIISRREHNLDHWDAETLAAYLGLDPNTAKPLSDSEHQYAGIDAAVMFYAQWCTNCHKFAPVWSTIGGLVKAGTTESNLIMALFNCELNDQHTRLCDATGVTHYPTIMFIGAGPYATSDPVSSFIFGGKNKASGPYGGNKLKRTAKFQGNLNVGDSVLDWVRTMQGLSKWYQWGHMEGGWLKTIRSMFFNPFEKKKGKGDVQKNALPVGVPPVFGGGYVSKSGSTETGAGSAKPSYVLQKELTEAEKKVEETEKQLKITKEANDHAGFIIESFLFPKMLNTTNEETKKEGPLDAFTFLHKAEGWNASLTISDAEKDDKPKKISIKDDGTLIIKACVIDISLDYCKRLSKKLTQEYLDSLSLLEDNKYPSFEVMEKELRSMVNNSEPYCAMFDECYSANFAGDKCRPATCPFKNDAACRYVGSCFSESIMTEYKDVIQQQLDSAVKDKMKKEAKVESSEKK